MLRSTARQTEAGKTFLGMTDKKISLFYILGVADPTVLG